MSAPLPTTRVATLTAEQKRLVDEYVEVREKWKSWQPPVNPHAARFAELKVRILGWFEKEPADVAFIAEGKSFKLPISARERKRTLKNLPALLRKLGQKWIAENCMPTLGAVEKAIPAEKLSLYIDEERSGPRNIGEPVRCAPEAK